MEKNQENKVEPYSYTPLHRPRSIRVLHLQPPPHAGSRRLVGSLQELALDDGIHAFTALSYTWGAPDFSRRILLRNDGDDDDDRGGKTTAFAITKNCEEALLHLRDHFDVRAIWVDAICINQADGAEKSGQIGLMLDIYRMARTVYVWLGMGFEAEGETKKALRWLQYASGENFPLLGLRMAGFPGNMHWKEVWKGVRVLPDVWRASACFFPIILFLLLLTLRLLFFRSE